MKKLSELSQVAWMEEQEAEAARARAGKCPRCQKAAAPDAQFCTRCGAALQPIVKIPFSVASVPNSMSATDRVWGDRPTASQTPRRVARAFLVLLGCALAIAGVLLVFARSVGVRVRPAIATVPAMPDFSAPEPPAPLVSPPASAVAAAGRATGAFVENAWADADAINGDGYVGVRVQANVYNPGAKNALFVVHFRCDDGSPVRGADPRFTDPAGNAAAAIAVPHGTGSPGARNVSIFVPWSALPVPVGETRVEAQLALFDGPAASIAQAKGAWFVARRETYRIARVQHQPPPNRFGYNGVERTLVISIEGSDAAPGPDGLVDVRLLYLAGTPLPGRPGFSNANGELAVRAPFSWSSAGSRAPHADVEVALPPALSSMTTAEITIREGRGEALGTPLSYRLP